MSLVPFNEDIKCDCLQQNCPYCGKKLDTFSDYSDVINKYFNEKVVVAEFGFNSVTNKPFTFLYDFGHVNDDNVIVYTHGNRNTQDSRLFKLNQIRLASDIDLLTIFWGK